MNCNKGKIEIHALAAKLRKLKEQRDKVQAEINKKTESTSRSGSNSNDGHSDRTTSSESCGTQTNADGTSEYSCTGSETDEDEEMSEHVRRMQSEAAMIPIPEPRQWPIGVPPKSNYVETEILPPEFVEYENHLRNRYKLINRPRSSTVDESVFRNAELAPSVTVDSTKVATVTLRKILTDLKLTSSCSDADPIYTVDHRFVNHKMLMDIVVARGRKVLETMKNAIKMKDASTQTIVTTVGVRFVEGCVNCRSGEHAYENCLLPLRPGICRDCGAESYNNQVYCACTLKAEADADSCRGCFVSKQLYTPTCGNCNVRYGSSIDWFKLNYVQWPWNFVTPRVMEIANMKNEKDSTEKDPTEIMKTFMRNKFHSSDKIKFDNNPFLFRDSDHSQDAVMIRFGLPKKQDLSLEKLQLRSKIVDTKAFYTHAALISQEKPELDALNADIIVANPYIVHASVHIGRRN